MANPSSSSDKKTDAVNADDSAGGDAPKKPVKKKKIIKKVIKKKIVKKKKPVQTEEPKADLQAEAMDSEGLNVVEEVEVEKTKEIETKASPRSSRVGKASKRGTGRRSARRRGDDDEGEEGDSRSRRSQKQKLDPVARIFWLGSFVLLALCVAAGGYLLYRKFSEPTSEKGKAEGVNIKNDVKAMIVEARDQGRTSARDAKKKLDEGDHGAAMKLYKEAQQHYQSGMDYVEQYRGTKEFSGKGFAWIEEFYTECNTEKMGVGNELFKLEMREQRIRREQQKNKKAGDLDKDSAKSGETTPDPDGETPADEALPKEEDSPPADEILE